MFATTDLRLSFRPRFSTHSAALNNNKCLDGVETSPQIIYFIRLQSTPGRWKEMGWMIEGERGPLCVMVNGASHPETPRPENHSQPNPRRIEHNSERVDIVPLNAFSDI